MECYVNKIYEVSFDLWGLLLCMGLVYGFEQFVGVYVVVDVYGYYVVVQVVLVQFVDQMIDLV